MAYSRRRVSILLKVRLFQSFVMIVGFQLLIKNNSMLTSLLLVSHNLFFSMKQIINLISGIITSKKLKVGNFKCHKCEFSSNKPEEIRNHAQKVHADLRSNQDINFRCNKCKFKSSELTLLQDHMSSHD